jgi:large subunit ribosomal protein L18
MSIQKRKQERVNRRIQRMRARVRGSAERPRLAVFRGLAHISAQIIDDTTGRTLASAYDRELKTADKKTKVEIAMAIGALIAERAKAKGVTQVVFDRRDKQYQGRVRALAESARTAGLIF